MLIYFFYIVKCSYSSRLVLTVSSVLCDNCGGYFSQCQHVAYCTKILNLWPKCVENISKFLFKYIFYVAFYTGVCVLFCQNSAVIL